MGNRPHFALGEWYHCYSRGVDKRAIFENDLDYQRFLEIMYLANSTEPVHRSNLNVPHETIFTNSRGEALTSVGAYALMPNHFHLLLYENNPGGISKFMQKLGISYTMYFNIKNDRVGNLFVKPFRSKHMGDDQYFQHCINYIHLNPMDLFVPHWKKQNLDIAPLTPKLKKYPYASVCDFYGETDRPEKAILGDEVGEVFTKKPLEDVVESACEYYAEISR